MKLEVIIGKTFEAEFTVVGGDGVTGVVLDPTDTATFAIATNGVAPACVLPPVSMVIQDVDNGIFKVTLTTTQTELLVQEVGFAEDKYPTVTNYNAILDFTLVDGDRTATMPLYALEVGIPCPTI